MSSGEGGRSRGPDRRLLLVGAGTAIALMVLVVVTTAKSAPILRKPDRDPNIHVSYGQFTAPTIPGGGTGQPTNRSSQAEAGLFGSILLYVVLGALLLLVLWLLAAAVASLLRRWRERQRAIAVGPLPDVDDAVLDAVSDATKRQEQRLREGAPSNAVIACWVDLEQSVAAAGVERRPSETSAELTLRVLDELDLDRAALRTLGALYREARYSAHQLTEQDRATALDALHTLGRSLPSHTGEPV